MRDLLAERGVDVAAWTIPHRIRQFAPLLARAVRRAAARPGRTRANLYRAIDERVYRDAPWIYLWFPVDLWAVQPDVEGWELPVIFSGQRWTGVRRRP